MVMSVRRNSLAFMGDECQVRQGPQHLQRRVDRLLADTREPGDEGSGRTEPDAEGKPGCDAAGRRRERADSDIDIGGSWQALGAPPDFAIGRRGSSRVRAFWDTRTRASRINYKNI